MTAMRLLHDCHMLKTQQLNDCTIYHTCTSKKKSAIREGLILSIHSECSAQGQEYYDGINTCVPCTGTCKEPDVACIAVCRSGCGCPVGTVLDEEANACVNMTDCPKGE